jgi:hypothetical protein
VVECLPSKPSKCVTLSSNPSNTKKKKKPDYLKASVAHACNPSYSGSRDQEDYALKLAGANSSQDPISVKPITMKGLIESACLAVMRPAVQFSVLPKKKKKRYLNFFT